MVSGPMLRATTPPSAGATDLAGVGSHLISPSSPTPQIRVDQPEECDNRPVPLATHNVSSFGSNNAQLKFYNRSCDAKGRPRSDSAVPFSVSDSGSGTSDKSSVSYPGLTAINDHVTPALPMRRNSFIKNALRLTSADNDGSDSDSTPMYSEDADSDGSRVYTRSRELTVQIPTMSQKTSVISDGGFQDHLEIQQSLEPKKETVTSVSRHVDTAVKRYALQKNIYKKMVKARSDDASLPSQQFLPKDEVPNVITHAAVAAELVKTLPGYSHEIILRYADTICNISSCYVGGRWRQRSYRSIFALLVLTDKSHLVPSFIQDKVSDLDLPLVPVRDCDGISGMRRRKLNPDGTPQPLLACFDDEQWSPSHRDQFDRYQWYMLAPFFMLSKNGQINHYPLHDQHILPFLSWHQAEDDAAEQSGGYGRVIMVRMHSASQLGDNHHKLGDKSNTGQFFAVKQLLASDRKSFKKERDMLKKFSGANSHPHIVSLLATYRHRGKYHFVFDRAQSDLRGFLENERYHKLNHTDVVWISKQCSGIAAGLFKIHRHKTFKVRGTDEDLQQEKVTAVTKQVSFSKDLPRKKAARSSGVDACGVEHAPGHPSRTFSSEKENSEKYVIRYGRHGDINPQNILWFTDEPNAPAKDLRGVFKIADFGTVEMNSQYSKSKPRDVANTMTYRPPECDAEDRTIRQSFDIWCLGCVLLELATWMLGGAPLVKRFAQSRLSRDPIYGNDKTDTYFELVWNKSARKTGARVKPSVLEV
ncbi:hypothetical protein FB567DRAFT_600879 [Paraphoma chrysanthemicola]|uniref:Protein kinase domain-containing protein n=1 Tax=Paraphoma chrysanthemicola TaxID=798071 RepID=A0A8K0W5F0_9PLEO|nr:hypothetical protein FB567DRAFT_600879 [Paraphoma chrysanthemicola]